MKKNTQIKAIRVSNEMQREGALEVIESTYVQEKHWVRAAEELFPSKDLTDPTLSWFLAFVDEVPAGILRVDYAPSLEPYLDHGDVVLEIPIDVEAFIKTHRIADIGRFAVVPTYRRQIRVALALMNSATYDTVQRSYTHYVTDIFEGEQHSPYLFHTRVMGFVPVASRSEGELNCKHRRITLLMDLAKSYNQLKKANHRLFDILTEGWDEEMHERFEPLTSANVAA